MAEAWTARTSSINRDCHHDSTVRTETGDDASPDQRVRVDDVIDFLVNQHTDIPIIQ